jgi:hypothetical protein
VDLPPPLGPMLGDQQAKLAEFSEADAALRQTFEFRGNAGDHSSVG